MEYLFVACLANLGAPPSCIFDSMGTFTTLLSASWLEVRLPGVFVSIA